jgi:tryptophan 2,3-dioxygenase
MGMAEHLIYGSPARSRVEAAMNRPSLWDSTLAYLATRTDKLPASALNRDVTTAWSPNEEVQAVLLDIHRTDADAAAVCERLVDLDEGLQGVTVTPKWSSAPSVAKLEPAARPESTT